MHKYSYQNGSGILIYATMYDRMTKHNSNGGNCLKKHVTVVAGLVLVLSATTACSTPTPSPVPIVPSTATQTSASPAPSSPIVSTPTVASAATATPPKSPTPGPKDALLAALNTAIGKAKTYRVRVPEEGRFIEVILPDRFHQIEPDGAYLIGQTYYQDSLLTKRQVTSIPYLDRVSLLWLKGQIGSSAQTKFLGPSVIDGAQTIGYSTEFPVVRISPPGTPGATPVILQMPPQIVKVWFNTTDGLPKRVELGAPNSVSANFYDYNVNIVINPPY